MLLIWLIRLKNKSNVFQDKSRNWNNLEISFFFSIYKTSKAKCFFFISINIIYYISL
jgi:hypothetical protein